jgi:DhnA family fructose-bisphosphate aldolase class Ia
VAVDHGFFGEGAFLTGIEDLPAAVATLAAAAPDAIQLTVGQARLLQHRARAPDRPSCCAPTSPTSTASSRPACPTTCTA